MGVPRRRLADLVRQTPALGPTTESLIPVLRRSPSVHTSNLDALCFDIDQYATAPKAGCLLPSQL